MSNIFHVISLKQRLDIFKIHFAKKTNNFCVDNKTRNISKIYIKNSEDVLQRTENELLKLVYCR